LVLSAVSSGQYVDDLRAFSPEEIEEASEIVARLADEDAGASDAGQAGEPTGEA
jgi:hypothetical protein